MLWSRKGVPGSERSGEAGTPFLGPGAEPNLGSERAAGWSLGWSAYRGPPKRPPEDQRPRPIFLPRHGIITYCPRRFLTVGSYLATHVRTVGRHDSSRGRSTAGRSAQSTPGGVRHRTPADRARIRSDRSVLDSPAGKARTARAQRLVHRRPLCHRSAANAPTLIRPAVGIKTIS